MHAYWDLIEALFFSKDPKQSGKSRRVGSFQGIGDMMNKSTEWYKLYDKSDMRYM